ncbi:MAG: Rrf2 family transcriptional regulator [Acidobacteria bacterium]|nr:Rrf2 family transcriptional regulator [Acidobacteriota bacterium]
MKFSAQEEYGLRCLLQIGQQGTGGSLTIPEISAHEGLSIPYVAKLVRLLRQGGFVKSTRGQSGGYILARPPEQIVVGEVLAVLGGRLFDLEYCERFPGSVPTCTHTVDCSIRSLWRAVQLGVDQILERTTLRDLLGNEKETTSSVTGLVQIGEPQPSGSVYGLSTTSMGD